MTGHVIVFVACATCCDFCGAGVGAEAVEAAGTHDKAAKTGSVTNMGKLQTPSVAVRPATRKASR